MLLQKKAGARARPSPSTRSRFARAKSPAQMESSRRQKLQDQMDQGFAIRGNQKKSLEIMLRSLLDALIVHTRSLHSSSLICITRPTLPPALPAILHRPAGKRSRRSVRGRNGCYWRCLPIHRADARARTRCPCLLSAFFLAVNFANWMGSCYAEFYVDWTCSLKPFPALLF